MYHELRAGDYLVSTDPALLDPAAIHRFLTRSYWAEGIPLALVQRALAHSLCFGAYHGGGQVGLARAVTDYATFGYLADVYILEEHRGRGLGKLLMRCVMSHPDLQGLRTWLLQTRDAHGLYRQYGFEVPTTPERVMAKRRDGLYKQSER